MQHSVSKQTLRVLLLEDVPSDAEFVEAELRSAGIEFVLMRVDQQDGFLEALDRFSPEIILSDYALPAFDGESALSIAREKAPGVPFIFVTGALGEDRAVDLLKKGATDFVLKDRLRRLPLCVKRALEEVEERRRLQQAEERLQRAYAELEQKVEKRTAELRQRTLELQRLNETLEQRVRERTAELSDLSSELLVAQEKERKRISYDLHDHVWQTLDIIKFQIEQLFPRENETDWAALRNRSSQVISLIRSTVSRVRSMQGDLWPSVLDDIGILATLEWYCREAGRNHPDLSMERHVHLQEEEVPAPVKIVIYRVMQEALANVTKHSRARHVALSLIKTDHRLEFTVRDDGIGFNPGETITKRSLWGGLGLLSMKQRTELSGGLLEVESAPGQGTTVRASWPI